MRRAAIVAACVAGVSAGVLGGPWKVPNPDTRAHPGAEAAPACSPKTYPDAAGFARRSALICQGLAQADLGTWRRGWFERGGDPGKYLPGPAMAKLLLGVDLDSVAKYMNDDRSYKEHYHFGTVNWARFYPLFSSVLTAETKQKFADYGFRYGSYLSPSGTENHKAMWVTSANVLPVFTGKGLSRRGKDQTLQAAKEMLRRYVRGLYAAGQGEWDSSTYLMFDANGMLNIYDFSEDDPCRLLAAAALDWYLAAYALKYTDGVYTAPNQRGFASGPVQTITDQTGYVWWGAGVKLAPADCTSFRYAMHAITSSYRPGRVLCNLAWRRLPKLPFESRNTKPNYWYGQNLPPAPGAYHEAVYVTKHYTMGGLFNGHGGQMTRFQIAARADGGAVVFTGGHPRKSDHTGKKTGFGFADGIGRYDQSAQVGSVHVCMSRVPADEPIDYAFFSIPARAAGPSRKGRWFVMQAGGAFVGLRPLGKAAVGQTTLTPAQIQQNEHEVEHDRPPRHKTQPIIKITGRPTGFVVQTADVESFRDLPAFAASLAEKVKVDDRDYAGKMTLVCTGLDGREIHVRYQNGKDRPFVAVGKPGEKPEPIRFDDRPIYDGPYVRQAGGVLTVNDGRDGFVVDFSGDMPVYKAWKP